MTTMECLKHPRWFYHKRETEELKIQLGFVKQQQIKGVHRGGVKYSITAECDIETIKKQLQMTRTTKKMKSKDKRSLNFVKIIFHNFFSNSF